MKTNFFGLGMMAALLMGTAASGRDCSESEVARRCQDIYLPSSTGGGYTLCRCPIRLQPGAKIPTALSAFDRCEKGNFLMGCHKHCYPKFGCDYFCSQVQYNAPQCRG